MLNNVFNRFKTSICYNMHFGVYGKHVLYVAKSNHVRWVNQSNTVELYFILFTHIVRRPQAGISHQRDKECN